MCTVSEDYSTVNDESDDEDGSGEGVNTKGTTKWSGALFGVQHPVTQVDNPVWVQMERSSDHFRHISDDQWVAQYSVTRKWQTG